MDIKCVVAATDMNGSPGFWPVIVTVNESEYQAGEHYDIAKELACDQRYSGGEMVVFDEHDGPGWLFERMFPTERTLPAKKTPKSGGKIITFRHPELEQWMRVSADSGPRTSWEARTSDLPEDLRQVPELEGMDGIRIDLRTGDLSAWSIDVQDDEDHGDSDHTLL